jgi:hypothetical protein
LQILYYSVQGFAHIEMAVYLNIGNNIIHRICYL